MNKARGYRVVLGGICDTCKNNVPDQRAEKLHLADPSFHWEPGEANVCKAAYSQETRFGKLKVPPGEFDDVHWNICVTCTEHRANP